MPLVSLSHPMSVLLSELQKLAVISLLSQHPQSSLSLTCPVPRSGIPQGLR